MSSSSEIGNDREYTKLGNHGEDIKITRQEKIESLSVEHKDANTRANFVNSTTDLFKNVNYCVLAILTILVIIDVYFMNIQGEKYIRIVNADVLLALLGATTVQLGAVMFTLSSSLFPKKE